jgi:hypothetical protein
MNLSSTSFLSDRLQIANNLWCFPAFTILAGSLPYLMLVIVVDNTFHMTIPFFVSSFFLLAGCQSQIKLPSVKFKRIFIDEKIIFRIILFMGIIELCAAKNLPLISLYLGPYVDYTDYGIPLVHSIFNSLSFCYIVLFNITPKMMNIQIKRATYIKSIIIFIFVFLTMQRMPLAYILVALALPFVLQSIIRTKRILFASVIPHLRSKFLILLTFSVFTLILFFSVGMIRNNLEDLSFTSFGDFSYSPIFSSLNQFFQVPLQYLFTPILNAYINIGEYNSTFLNTLPHVSPYLYKILNISSIFNISTPEIYLVNPMFNAIHSPSSLYYSSVLGTIIFCLYSFVLGVVLSKRCLLSTNSMLGKYTFPAFDSRGLSIALVLTSAYTLGFFIPWYGYPITIISLATIFLSRTGQ